MIPSSPLSPSATDTSFYSGQAMSSQVRNDPKKVGGMFESIFYRTILNQMRDSSLEEDPFGSSSSAQQVRGMMDDELANVWGQKGYLGISDMITKQQKQGQLQNPAEAIQAQALAQSTTTQAAATNATQGVAQRIL